MTVPPIVSAYVAAVNAGDHAALTALFCDDAVLRHPIGTFIGMDEIAGFYRDVVLAGQAELTSGSALTDGPCVMAELIATSPLDSEARVYAVDVFRLAPDGRITQLDIYYR